MLFALSKHVLPAAIFALSFSFSANGSSPLSEQSSNEATAAVDSSREMGTKELNRGSASKPATDADRHAMDPALPAIHLCRQVLERDIPVLQKQFRIPGVSVALIDEGELAWSHGFGVVSQGGSRAVRPDTVMQACSMSKPFFACMVLQMAERGELDLNTPLVNLLGQDYLNGDPRHRRITARMVLNHTTGLPNWRQAGPEADDYLTRHHLKDGVLQRGLPLKLVAEPGEQVTYSGEGFLMLQLVLEKVRQESLATWSKRSLIGPLGLRRSSFQWRSEFAGNAANGHDEAGERLELVRRF